MRRFPISLILLILTSAIASSPLEQFSHREVDVPLSRRDVVQIGDPSDQVRRSTSVDGSTMDSLRIEERATYNCSDLKATFDRRCWVELGLSGFLIDPTAGWNHTVRICEDVESVESNDGSDCCKTGEPWTTCFLRLAHGTPGQDCSQINSQFCAYQSNLDPSMDPAVKPQYQYIMKNIYCKSVEELCYKSITNDP